jgi:D-threo-aldose 1-dehydrogenase
VITSLGTASLGLRGPQVTRLGLGCAPIGNLYDRVDDAEAAATVDAAWDAGVRYFDTAPLYGHGLSERRLGRALAGRPRDDYVLCSKVGRVLRPTSAAVDSIFALPDQEVARSLAPVFDLSADGIRRSLDESLTRLGTDHLDVALLHDPDDHEEQALAEAMPTLVRLRDEGIVTAVGVGMNQWEMLDRFVQRVDLDLVLVAGRATLLDRSAAEVLLPRCRDAGVGVVVGGVFNSGVLAAPGPTATYDYGEVPEAVADRVERLGRACSRAGVPLAAAALQWALRQEVVSCVLVGARSAAELGTDVEWATTAVPDELWDELEAIR